MIGQKWMIFTVGEALSKTVAKSLQKAAGIVSTTLAHAFFATFLVGLVQASVGFIVAKRQNRRVLYTRQNVIGACLFGLFAMAITALGFATFVYEGDIGVSVFLITLSIIPCALIDRVFFKHPLVGRQWIGMAIGLLAGYVILGSPSLREASTLPVWVWMSIAIAVMLAINQAITQKIQNIDPFVKNFWGGVVQVVLGGAGTLILGKGFTASISQDRLLTLVAVSVIVGFIVVAMWTFNLFAYRGGGTIALKKLVMNAVYLITAMFAGIVFFQESLTPGKVFGVVLYLVSFILFDPSTWKTVTARLKLKNA